MIALVLQLSDIHIRGDADPVLERVGAIVAAARGLATQVDGVVLALTGDIAFSGSEAEFTIALAFVRELRDALRTELHIAAVEIVVIPGNHDCDFQSPTEARSVVLDALANKPRATVDDSMLELCTEVQRAFFDFRTAVDGARAPSHERLVYEYRYEAAGESLLFRCINTAWVSQLREQQGSLIFPQAMLPTARQDAAVVITMFHHPYNWLESGNAREFRKVVEASSDIILTGHEHDFTQRQLRGRRGERNLYIEADALQDVEAPQSSGFNVLMIDTQSQRQRLVHFEWSDGLYVETDGPSDWDEYQVSRLAQSHGFRLSDASLARVRDLGVALSHPARGLLSLDDVFVYPDLREVSYRALSDVPKLIRGETLLGHIGALERVLITGAEKSGKSTFAKRLFSEFHNSGFVPVLIDGQDFRDVRPDRLLEMLARIAMSTYELDVKERYTQLPRSRRAVIVDNYHRLAIRADQRMALLKFLSGFAAQVVLLSNDVAQQVQDIVAAQSVAGESVSFTHYRIVPYGHLRRNEIAERWFKLDPTVAADEELFARRVVEVKRLMDTAIGSNFIPSYPVFILPILQAQEHNEHVDLNASTYGYVYELLIRRSLAATSTKETLDVKLAYLAFLAYSVFQRGASKLSDQDFRAIHSEYEQRFAISVPYAHMQNELLRAQILETSDDHFWFKYGYIYYYFVASYLRDHMTDPVIQGQVAELAASLHHEDSANILLFLVHLSKHPFIIEQLLRAGAEVFKGSVRADLTPGRVALKDVEESLKHVVYTEERDARQAALRRLDGLELERRERERLEQEMAEAKDVLERTYVAFKTLQILGQFLKNFPGSMEAGQKLSIATECYGIGLRTLGFILTLIEENKQEVLDSIVDTMKDEQPYLSSEDLYKRARESLFGLVCLGAYGVVKRISAAVGSRDLAQTYRALHAADPVPSVELVDMSIRLDQFAGFPSGDIERLAQRLENNPVAELVLKGLIINHFHMFKVDFDIKQRVCAKLNIEYKRLQGFDPRARLLPPARGGDAR